MSKIEIIAVILALAGLVMAAVGDAYNIDPLFWVGIVCILSITVVMIASISQNERKKKGEEQKWIM